MSRVSYSDAPDSDPAGDDGHRARRRRVPSLVPCARDDPHPPKFKSATRSHVITPLSSHRQQHPQGHTTISSTQQKNRHISSEPPRRSSCPSKSKLVIKFWRKAFLSLMYLSWELANVPMTCRAVICGPHILLLENIQSPGK